MEVPRQWRDYPCDDYFVSPFALAGYWDEDCQFWLIEPHELIEQPVPDFLQVGRAGVDSIAFGYRKGINGFWAWHPMEGRFQHLGASVQEFIEEWLSGRIKM